MSRLPPLGFPDEAWDADGDYYCRPHPKLIVAVLGGEGRHYVWVELADGPKSNTEPPEWATPPIVVEWNRLTDKPVRQRFCGDDAIEVCAAIHHMVAEVLAEVTSDAAE